MQKYLVAYTVSKIEFEEIEAENFDDAIAQWEAEEEGSELFFIEDESGEQRVFV